VSSPVSNLKTIACRRATTHPQPHRALLTGGRAERAHRVRVPTLFAPRHLLELPPAPKKPRAYTNPLLLPAYTQRTLLHPLSAGSPANVVVALTSGSAQASPPPAKMYCGCRGPCATARWGFFLLMLLGATGGRCSGIPSAQASLSRLWHRVGRPGWDLERHTRPWHTRLACRGVVRRAAVRAAPARCASPVGGAPPRPAGAPLA
jgi:hypothetical protein